MSESAAVEATAASRRLDSAFRIYLAEQGSKLVHRDELASLVGGASRLLLAANSLATLPIRVGKGAAGDERLLDGELHGLSTSFENIADYLSPAHSGFGSSSGHNGGAPSLPAPVDVPAGTPNSACARWIHHHLSHLQAGIEPLSAAAAVLRDAHGPLAR